MAELIKALPADAVGRAQLQLRTLQRYYTIPVIDPAIIELLEQEPELSGILTEAVQPLRSAFGESRRFEIRLQESDDDSLLKVAAQPVSYTHLTLPTNREV